VSFYRVTIDEACRARIKNSDKKLAFITTMDTSVRQDGAYFFLLLPNFCRSNYPRRKQLHRRMKYSLISLSLSSHIPVGTDAKKYFMKMVEETTLSPDAQDIFLKKRKGGEKETVA